MSAKPQLELWLATGSQHLYGPEVLKQVQANSKLIADGLSDSPSLPIAVKAVDVLTDPDAIHRLAVQANADPNCAGLILWMHTFSPAKMWIRGLSVLSKPVLHLHTQFNRDLPWGEIDMDFMNLNQAAHGDREAGHLHTRIGLSRTVAVGHWSDPAVQAEIGTWARVARAWADLQGAKVCRIGDNMREVSVTEGDKVAAEMRFGFSTNGYGVGDVVATIQQVDDAAVTQLCAEYLDLYDADPALLPTGARHASLRDAARQELGLRAFLEARNAKAFTTTFEDLHGLNQLPGLACQRLMGDGYGFGAEGDWKTSALLRFCKVLAEGLPGGTSFMEDYTYHLESGNNLVLGSHMLEICPSISASKPRLEVHPLGIGGKDDPVRLVFNSVTGPALNASLIDLGHRFRLIVNEVDSVPCPALPKLPVARALWQCKPDFRTAAAGWIYAGGAHHTVFTTAFGTEALRIFAEIAGIECVVIDESTKIPSFRQELMWNEAAYKLHGKPGF